MSKVCLPVMMQPRIEQRQSFQSYRDGRIFAKAQEKSIFPPIEPLEETGRREILAPAGTLLVQSEVLELRRVIRSNNCVDLVGHAPVQHLVMDRNIELLFLHHRPYIRDHPVALVQISL